MSIRLTILICLTFTLALALNDRPIIGILNEPTSSGSESYFSASYVKWLEASGARVAVIPYNADMDTLSTLFNSVNGILFTGGGQSLAAGTEYYETASFLFNNVLQANAKGDYFPVWGTCMGIQLLCIMVSGNHSILSENAFDSENLGLALNFTDAAASSRLFGSAPAESASICPVVLLRSQPR